jgi:hypothetical protein
MTCVVLDRMVIVIEVLVVKDIHHGGGDDLKELDVNWRRMLFSHKKC